MKLFIACDHAAFPQKEELKEYLMQNHEVVDLGTDSEDSVHYPMFAQKLAHEVLHNEGAMGVLLCGSGIGVSMVANRNKGIRAALCRAEYDAKMSRMHNDANVICLGGRVTPMDELKKLVDVFVSTEFEGGRHQIRIDMFN
jgi:ribose 5-phosphate isomerase B